jgi:superfamily II DNA or RNA helicase
MGSINRFSSRLQRLDHAFLRDKLHQALSYKRIAGYFRSSIFELVGEELAGIPNVRILCNSELDAADIAVSKAVREAALKERWNQVPVEIEAILQRERYRKLYNLLSHGNVQVRVIPRDRVFIHGKAGVIETPQGKTCFLGSINETRSAFEHNYEILWEDTSPEGVVWVEEEFEALWKESYALPDAIISEVKRVAERVEVRFDEIVDKDLPAAALAEAPIYRGGEQLQPWQRAFVTQFLADRETYGQARLLLADEVGLGKTLSLAASAMVAALLGDGPVLILCPSTLTFQWQVELKDHLGVPSAIWLSSRKQWMDPDEHLIKTLGPQDVVRCPYRIAIVSTGLIFQDSVERAALLEQRYGTVILDEAHKARRRGGLGASKDEPNNLLDFMLQIALRTRHLLLGTGTPIQTAVSELWDLLRILNGRGEFVLGREAVSFWADSEQALPFVTGEQIPVDEKEAWELLRNPLPPGREDALFSTLRQHLGMEDRRFISTLGLSGLEYLTRQLVMETLDGKFFRRHNPVVRHTILRRRDTLEEQGLLEKIRVNLHPAAGLMAYPGQHFAGQALLTNHAFDLAYNAAEDFCSALAARKLGSGFMKSLLLQRICSSFAAGKATAERLLYGEASDDDDNPDRLLQVLVDLSDKEAAYLRTVIGELSRPEARDPKLAAVQYFLRHHLIEGKTWLEHGCIIFSQYYDTAYWIASELAKTLPDEPIAVYAGLGKSGLFRGPQYNAAEREAIKNAVKERQIRLVVATDAACEGLNLQTLGMLINVDLPWNPSRLEQRLGRIKRFGQTRRSVDMLNLVYHDTQDEKIYSVLSKRLKDKFDIFGSLPDTIDDDWIENAEKLDEMMNQYIHMRQQTRNIFDERAEAMLSPNEERWELCERVLSRRDVVERMSEPWG